MDIACNADKARRHTLRAWASPAICYASALAIPFGILLATFALLDIYPFGDVSVMVHDMPVQYADYFGEYELFFPEYELAQFKAIADVPVEKE